MEAKKKLGQREDDNGASLEYSSLPPEMINEILLLLPAKSIGRFRCVSKLFHSLSSELGFVKRHTGINSGYSKLLVASHNLYTVDLDSVGRGIMDLVAAQRFLEPCYARKRLEHIRTSCEIIGSSNGLVLIFQGKVGAFLYNLTTGESKIISESNFYCSEPYGFGFDALSDDYKVVKLVPVHLNYHNVNSKNKKKYHKVEVYSLKKDSWRRIKGRRHKYIAFTSGPGVYLNGAIHWAAEKGVVNEEGMVVAVFDFKTEKFRDIPFPDDACDCKYLHTANLKGRLCLVFDYFVKWNVMWVMNEYGVERSWSKIQLGMLYGSLTPLWSSTRDDDEVLLNLDEKLVLYNFESKAIRNLNINYVRGTSGAVIYVESLVSPNSYGNNGMKI